VSYDPYFIQTEFEVLQSGLVLDAVIAQLNLNVEWGRKYFNGETLKTTETLEILKGRLSLAPVRGTKLIAITVYSDDPREAARVANAIGEAYRDYRNRTRAEQLAKAVEVLPPGPQRDAAQLALQKPQPTLVQIVDRAEPGKYPVKPNKPLNLALGAVAGGLLGLVVASVVVWLSGKLGRRGVTVR
jgi:uncharacterized protein involved in exopolysaccharide biosynthesis